MSERNVPAGKASKIIYWVATIWLCLGMFSSGLVQLLRVKEEVSFVLAMGYPIYFLTILGTWKMLGILAVLAPRFPLIKEWAYAGFFFTATGALFSHLACGNPAKDMIGPVLLLLLTVVSWYFRPAERRLVIVKQ
jgi:hypothetical protein